MPNKTASKSGLKDFQRQALLVLGMHRSGTSALTGSLEILGSTSPATQIAGGEQNPRGFFESKPIARLNDSLLSVFERTWDDWRPLLQTPARQKASRQHTDLTLDILKQEFGDAPLISIKDPRVCRLLPFWLQALEQNSITPLIVFPIRHPEEVAHSLRKRNGFSREHGLILWLAHVLAAEKNTRGRKRCFTRFSQLLSNPVKLTQRIEATLEISFPSPPESCAAEFNDFLSQDLRHFNVHEEAVPAKLFRIYRIFKRWSNVAENPEDYEILDDMHAHLSALGKSGLLHFTQGETASNNAAAKVAFELLFYANRFWGDALPLLEQSKPLTKADINQVWQAAIVAGSDHRRSLARKLKQVPQAQANELGQLARLMVETDDARRTALAEITTLRTKSSRQADHLAKLTTQKRDLARQVQDNEALINELHALVARVENNRKTLENQNNELHALVARVENDRKALENQNNELHALVARVENDRKALEDQNNELHTLVARIEEERSAIAESTTWRATAPVRKALSTLRGAKPDSASDVPSGSSGGVPEEPDKST